MAENKTQATTASVATYLAAIDNPARQADCATLLTLMQRVSGESAVMWGPGIVGFGSYHYHYESGREGDMCLTGFSSRKTGISIYLTASSERQAELLTRLGKHKMGKACLSINKLSDIDLGILEQLIADSLEARR